VVLGRLEPIHTDRALRLTPAQPFRLAQSLRLHRFGAFDPTCIARDDILVKAFWTPAGPCTLALRQEGREIAAEAAGPGADWALARVPGMFAFPDPQELPPGSHSWLKKRAAFNKGLRVTPVLWAGDVLVTTILQQRVTWREAARSYQKLVLKYGTRAPGPLDLRVPLSGQQLADLPTVALRAEGVDMRRAGAIRNAAPYLARLDAAGSRAELLAILQRLPGVGPWTIGNVMGYAGGDPDAVPVGDLHLPRHVGEAFEGTPADDRRMLELLEPYRGLRFRVLLWIMAG